MTASQISASYEVGYGKPPRYSQFQKGRSGNPGGRPRGTRRRPEERLKALALQEAYRHAVLVEDGIARPVTMLQTVLRKQLELAAAGNVKAMRDVLERIDDIEESDCCLGVIRDEYYYAVNGTADRDDVEDDDIDDAGEVEESEAGDGGADDDDGNVDDGDDIDDDDEDEDEDEEDADDGSNGDDAAGEADGDDDEEAGGDGGDDRGEAGEEQVNEAVAEGGERQEEQEQEQAEPPAAVVGAPSTPWRRRFSSGGTPSTERQRSRRSPAGAKDPRGAPARTPRGRAVRAAAAPARQPKKSKIPC